MKLMNLVEDILLRMVGDVLLGLWYVFGAVAFLVFVVECIAVALFITGPTVFGLVELNGQLGGFVLMACAGIVCVIQIWIVGCVFDCLDNQN